MKIYILGCFSKAEEEECDQKNQSFSDKSGMVMVGSGTYFLELSTYISLKVASASKDYFRDKATMKV